MKTFNEKQNVFNFLRNQIRLYKIVYINREALFLNFLNFISYFKDN